MVPGWRPAEESTGGCRGLPLASLTTRGAQKGISVAGLWLRGPWPGTAGLGAWTAARVQRLASPCKVPSETEEDRSDGGAEASPCALSRDYLADAVR